MREPGRSPEFVSRDRIFGRSLIEIDTFWSPSYFSEGDYVYLAYRVENRMTLPLYAEVNGGAVTELKPGIGHRGAGYLRGWTRFISVLCLRRSAGCGSTSSMPRTA
ncbi:hypothetical protein CRM94_06935 [Burkholderia gladioli]|uniref:Uncharacterized protein n=1 Tax=Burkholderia gladioli TaxID=28095 RepID=A0A2A7SDW8_BURGA|nr:hypothetical protein CRM94_06935 [Burkholderia gladioli]